MKLRNVSLEMSLKPFLQVTDEYIENICRTVFRQWLPLLRDAQQASVLLWTADGSEILTYQGELDQPIEWARYIGGAAPHWKVPGDPEGICLHSRPYLYTEKPATITYRDLKRIVAAIKRVGQEMTGLPIRVGETFDPGCEFAKSPFKYQKHSEICMADTGGPKSFACCYATLNADSDRYAGFPSGIPQDTPLGTFLGRQLQHLLTDMGFDYIWLSNGFGFGLETWMVRGPMFDGRVFDPSQAKEIKEKILNFWRTFRNECPKFGIETRGTNLCTGIDLASDAVPTREIYNGGFSMTPPPNSPWAALNGDFGLELAGYMSHISGVPDSTGYPFRFYTHDPWWHNSPWLDRYGREFHDIYMPMSVGLVNSKGAVRNPDSILFLTIDDSFGRLPDQVPNEVIPHIQHGARIAPDACGPVVWVYPFDEFHDRLFSSDPRPDEAFFNDWFIRSAITCGLPLNTVVSSKNFLATDKAIYGQSVLVVPVPDAADALNAALVAYIRQGGKVLLYGPTRRASKDLLELLNLKSSTPISGTLSVKLHECPDAIAKGAYPATVEHRPIMCAGGCEEILAAPADGSTNVLATASADGQTRVIALARKNVAWVRGTNSSAFLGGDLISGRGHLPTADDPEKLFQAEVLMRFALGQLGQQIVFQKKTPGQRTPIVTISRHNNAFCFAGFVPDMTVETRLKFPQGAPVFLGTNTEIVDGFATYRMPRAWQRECRVFVEQSAGGVVACVEMTAEMIGLKRRLRISGLQDATVRIYPENNGRPVIMHLNGSYPFYKEPQVKYDVVDDETGHCQVARNLTGELTVTFPTDVPIDLEPLKRT